VPRAVALDPLPGTEHPVLADASGALKEVVQRAEQLCGPDAARLRGQLHLHRLIVEQLEVPDAGTEILDDTSALARRLDGELTSGERVLHRVGEMLAAKSGWPEVVLDGGHGLLERRRARGELHRTVDHDAVGQGLAERVRK